MGFGWLKSEMYGYMGSPFPTQMTVLQVRWRQRGPLAAYLGFSVVPMIVSKRLRPSPGILGWAGVILVFSVILLTLSRGGLMYAILGTVIHLTINRGQAGRQIAIGVVLIGGAAWFGMDRIPMRNESSSDLRRSAKCRRTALTRAESRSCRRDSTPWRRVHLDLVRAVGLASR